MANKPLPLVRIKPVLAYELFAGDPQARYDWVLKNATAVEYTPNPLNLDTVEHQVNPFLEMGIPVRFHTRYPGWELGSADRLLAEEAFKKHARTLDIIAGMGEPFVTIHLGLNPLIELDPDRAEANLCRLVDHAEDRGIFICLENLRTGLASEPENILAWAEASGCRITLDVGHALSSEVVIRGAYSVREIVDMFSPRLAEVHIYGKEDERGHHPISDMEAMTPVLERLLETGCKWWTIELKDTSLALDTKQQLLERICL